MQCQPGSGQAGVEQTGVLSGCCCAAAAALPIAPSHMLGARPNHIRFVVCTKFWLLSAYSSDNELIQLNRRVPSASSSPSSDFIDLYVLQMQIPLVIMSSTVFYLLISLLSLVQLAKGSLSLPLSVIFCDNIVLCDMSVNLFLSLSLFQNSAKFSTDTLQFLLRNGNFDINPFNCHLLLWETCPREYIGFQLFTR